MPKKGRPGRRIKGQLGKAILNARGGKRHVADKNVSNKSKARIAQPVRFKDYTPNTDAPKNVGQGLFSVTEQGEIDGFLSNAMAAKEAYDEDRVFTLVLPKAEAERDKAFQGAFKKKEVFDYEDLAIPRRPPWTRSMTAAQINAQEGAAFLDWRRKVALNIQDTAALVTPYEKNLNVWRQLWRVVERSHVVVQIVDARSPLVYLSKDLLRYVKEVGEEKRCVILVNKSDYLSPYQRRQWAEYFESVKIRVLFFSAMREQIKQDLASKAGREQLSERRRQEILENTGRIEANIPSAPPEGAAGPARDDQKETAGEKPAAAEDTVPVIDCETLLAELRALAVNGGAVKEGERAVLGFTGYPNVGKSSVINVLFGDKKVAMSQTPGKTKNFQTLNLSDDVMLCDCPGLVFPTKMASKSELVLCGVIPVDQLTDFMTPMRLLAYRVPRHQLQRVYHLQLDAHSTRAIRHNARSLLRAYATRKNWFSKGRTPNESMAARTMLKDFVKGNLLYCHPPPQLDEPGRLEYFNSQPATSLVFRDDPTETSTSPTVENGLMGASEVLPDERPANYMKGEEFVTSSHARKKKKRKRRVDRMQHTHEGDGKRRQKARARAAFLAEMMSEDTSDSASASEGEGAPENKTAQPREGGHGQDPAGGDPEPKRRVTFADDAGAPAAEPPGIPGDDPSRRRKAPDKPPDEPEAPPPVDEFDLLLC